MQVTQLQGTAIDFERWAQVRKPLVEQALARHLDQYLSHPASSQSPLLQAMHHGVMNGGKRVRGLAVLATAELLDIHHIDLLEIAVAVEFIHAYSLIHDDLPCMDDDDLRRGQPTVHVVYGQAQALLAGDALQTEAFNVLANLDLNAEAKIELIRELSMASGAVGMAGGQAIDCHHVGQSMTLDQMRYMHQLKTGALLKASFKMGALCNWGVSSRLSQDLMRIDQYAGAIGLLFQVIDDVLDESQSTEILGKTAGKDKQDNKPTYVKALGLDGAREYAQKLYQEALVAIEPYGEKAQVLADLAGYCLYRVN